MTDDPLKVSAISGWHAHVYYDPATTKPDAAALREQVEARFAVQMGRWHDANVGPHPVSMYQIAFATGLFATLVPFLALNRRGLTVLVHPNTDSPHDDHLDHALWMGTPLPLDATHLPHSLEENGSEQETIVPNTTPTISPL